LNFFTTRSLQLGLASLVLFLAIPVTKTTCKRSGQKDERGNAIHPQEENILG
jgi:hypothetical protein